MEAKFSEYMNVKIDETVSHGRGKNKTLSSDAKTFLKRHE